MIHFSLTFETKLDLNDLVAASTRLDDSTRTHLINLVWATPTDKIITDLHPVSDVLALVR